MVCLFPKLDNALAFGEHVRECMTPFPNNEEVFGRQIIVNEDDEIIGKEQYLLINATTISFDTVYDHVTEYGGIMIPAHIDKSSTSLMSNLGFIPPDSKFACAEVKHLGFLDKLKAEQPYLNGCNIIHDSDAHYLEHIHEPEYFIEADSKSVPDILKALTGR